MSADADPLPPVPGAWEPPTLLTDKGERWTVEGYIESAGHRHSEGITGLWFPDQNSIVMTPRWTHHNQQLGTLEGRGVLGGQLRGDFVPWTWDTHPSGAELDFPRSAGGAFQWVTRNEPENVTYRRSGDEVDEGDAYAIVYAARRVDVPGESMARLEYLPLESPYSKGTTRAVEFGVRTERRPLDDWYREMRFAGELPEPAFNRDLDIDPI